MSKKKKNSGSSVVHSPSQIYNNALLRFETACDHLIGPGHFGKFSKLCHARLMANRFNAVKLKFKAGVTYKSDMLKYYQEIFSSQLSQLTFVTKEGDAMPVSLYLREGLGLIIYTGAMKGKGPVLFALSEQFAPYLTEDLLTKPVAEVVFLLHKMSIILSDWSKVLFSYSVTGLSSYDESTNDNIIWGDFIKPDSCMVKLDGMSREAIRLTWSDINGGLEYLSLSPSAIGFRSMAADQKFEVYIQKHALQRLDERLGLMPGVIHHAIFEMLKRGDFACFRSGAASLVRFTLWEKKLGYLVCGLFGDKIVIRTFLFLTNDGTPEGKRLSELTSLERLDKKYLEIDSLSGFLGLKISEDPGLSALFTEAGCTDLLDLSELSKYYMAEFKERDPNKLLSYMMGIGKKEEEVVEG